jgi:sugar phosphate isomerase/epimerase
VRRRQFLGYASLAGVAAAWGQSRSPFRFSVCNETFQTPSLADQCRMAHGIGYQGIEIMPGTLSEDPVAIAPARRAEIRRVIGDHGLHFVGLHNILTVPAGLHATTSDAAVRQRTWQFVRRLIDLSSDLGPNSVLVFGSGKQREMAAGASKAETLARFGDELGSLAGHARERSVTILIEPLAPRLCNFINNLEEAAEVVRRVDSPAVQTMFDVHNTAGETLSTPDLIDRYIRMIRHVHLNEMDGRRPGTGTYNYTVLLRSLERQQYEGWLSLEVFDFKPSGDAVAAEALKFLRSAMPSANA